MAKRGLLLLALVFAFARVPMFAQTIVLAPSTTTLTTAGGSLTFTVNLSYNTAPSALAVSVFMPLGWSYVSGTGEPTLIRPNPGDTTDATHPLGWAYDTAPNAAASFTFTVSYPANVANPQTLLSQVITRDSPTSTATAVNGAPVTLNPGFIKAVWGGNNGSWNDATQWNPNVVPNAISGTTIVADVSAGTVTIPTGTNVTLSELWRNGGTITGANSSITVTGPGSNWSTGAFTNLAKLIVGNTGYLTVGTSAAHDFSGTEVRNEGYMAWQDSGQLRSGNGGALVNASGATFLDRNTPSTTPAIILNGFGGTFGVTNNGMWVKSGTGATSVRVPFTNTGSLLVNAGTLEFTSTFSQTSGFLRFAPGASLTFTSGASFDAGSALIAAGTLTGNITNAGVLVAGDQISQLTINGNLSLLASSVVMLEIAGTSRGVTYDTISVNGSATLGGTLVLKLLTSAQSPISSTDTFSILTATSLTGQFLNAANGGRIVTADGGNSFQINYSSTGVLLTNFVPVPEPSTWVLMLIGSATLGFGAWRRRARR